MADARNAAAVGSSWGRGQLVAVIALCALVCSPVAAEGQPWALDRYAPEPVISGGPSGQTTADTADFGLSLQETAPSAQAFADVPSSSPLYVAVQLESARGVVTGYACGGAGEPCDNASRPYFRPDVNTTRALLARMLATAAGWSDAVSGQTFTDVPPSNPFWFYVERAASRGALSGYPCGSPPAGACDAQNRPYFMPGTAAGRGDLAQALDVASLFADPVSGQTYTDVPIANPLYTPVERLTALGLTGGYPCGTAPAGACDMQNRPYFLPGTGITRGQAVAAIAMASRSPEVSSCSLMPAHGSVASGGCSAQVSYTGLALDDYTFTLTGSDQVGNHQSATRQFTVVAQPPPDSEPRTTSTAVSCSPAAARVGEARSCTATVNDTSQGPASFPTGSVGVTTDSPGTFSPTAGCTLSPTVTQGQSSCALGYTPTAAGDHRITASYGGDGGHTTSSGAATLTVSSTPSNNFTVVPRVTCARVCHVIVVKIAVPGTGTVSAQEAKAGRNSRAVSSAKRKKNRAARIKSVNATATKAGIVRLHLRPTKAGNKILKQRGKLQVTVRITFTPTGGTPKSKTTTVTFRGK